MEAILPAPKERVRAALAHPQGRSVAVVGAGRSGIAAARLLASKGAQVFVEDDRGIEANVLSATDAQESAIRLHGNGIDAQRVAAADIVVVSPGVPLARQELVFAYKQGALIVGEVDVGLAFSNLPQVAVTGTNGKSTTTTMLGSFFSAANRAPFVGGNLGKPLCNVALDTHSYASLVLEFSSYQLELCSLLQARSAVITNLAPDHLDRYSSVEAYYAAKLRLIDLLADDATLVARQLDIESGRLPLRAGLRCLSYGPEQSAQGAVISAEQIHVRCDELEHTFAVHNPNIRGYHNYENCAAAILASLSFGLSIEDIEKGIDAYTGIEHRLENVAEVNGVLYVNDSKGTNVDATVQALRAFDAPILLIAGGRDKGTGYADLVDAAKKHVRVLLTIGESAPLIEAELGPVVDTVVRAQFLANAVAEAARLAKPGDVVLLSPACASFDQFANFEQRGRQFVAAVNKLVEDA